MATVTQSVRATGTLASTREDVEYMKGILLLERNTNPITFISNQMGMEDSVATKYAWFEDDLVPDVDRVNYGTGYDGSSTAIVVDTGELFAAGDLVRAVNTNEVMLVTSVSSDTLTVVRDFGQAGEGWTAKAGSLDDNDYLEIIGNAFEQGHPLPAIKTTLEVEKKGYVSDIRTPYGVSEVTDAVRLRGEQEMSYLDRKRMIEHLEKVEKMNIWAKPYVGDKGLYVAATGNTAPTVGPGINHILETGTDSARLVDQTDLTQSEFEDFLEVLFEYGSDTKYCFCDAKLRTALDRWGVSKLNTFTNETVMGMAVNLWRSSHGDVVFRTHRLLKNPDSADYRYAFFLDFDAGIKQVFLQGIGTTRVRDLNVYAATGETVKKKEVQTIQGLKLPQANKHGRLRFKTISA